jgi:RNA polymerase sigma factor (sigma-70 family)
MNQIYEKAKNGDRSAEQALFSELFVRFRHFAARKVGEENVEEVVQRACVTVLEKYKTETFTVGFSAWAYGVLKMTIRRFYQNESRRQDKEMQLPDDYKLPSGDVPHPMLQQYLLECIKWLAKSFQKYARILNLRYQGYSTSEICSKLGLNQDQYYVYVGRGRSKLRDCLLKKGAII